MAAPTSVAELAEAVRAADGPLVVHGAGTKQSWGGVPAGAPLSTAGLGRVLEHAAGDLVVRVQAGVPLADLQDQLATAGQWLALDPPEPGATVGGVVATAATGPRRLRYGAVRDLLIGVTYVLSDGTVARAGGRVVKNVAGYDLCKLLAGSFGTLAVLAELTLRLHPRPRETAVVRVEVPEPAAAAAAVQALLYSQQEPAAADYADGTLTVLVDGDGAAARAARLAGEVGGQPVPDVPDGFGARPWSGSDVGVKVAVEPAATAALLTALAAAGARRVGGPLPLGVLYAALPSVDVVPELRARLAGVDGSVVVLAADPAARVRVDPWGPVAGLALMRRVKAQFDPAGKLAPGRFVGGL